MMRLPSWLLGAYCLAYYLLAGVAINLGYHRVLSHRALKIPKWLERFAVALGLPAGTPLQWAGNHRFHHANADLEKDPHSPVLGGFWHAHVGWYIQTDTWWVCLLYSLSGPFRALYDGWNRARTNREYDHLAPDVAADPFYAWVSRPWPYLASCWLHTALFYGLAFAGWGWRGVAAEWLTAMAVYNLGDAIDSMAHLVGERPYASTHHARNHWFLGFLTLGEGWHANHHEFPSSARHGLLPGQPDWTWGMICLLARVGWASDIKLPAPSVIEERRARARSGLDGQPG